MGVVLILTVVIVLAPILWRTPRVYNRVPNGRTQPFEA